MKDDEATGRKAFAKRLKELMDKRDPPMNNNQLAKTLKKNPGHTENWIKGRRIPTLYADWEALCFLFGVTPQFLLFGEQCERRVEPRREDDKLKTFISNSLLSTRKEYVFKVRIECAQENQNLPEIFFNLMHCDPGGGNGK